MTTILTYPPVTPTGDHTLPSLADRRQPIDDALRFAAQWLQQAMAAQVGVTMAQVTIPPSRYRLMAGVAYVLCAFGPLAQLERQIIAEIADDDDGDPHGHDATIARRVLEEFTGRLFAQGAAQVPGYEGTR